jgi:hypothetical protein
VKYWTRHDTLATFVGAGSGITVGQIAHALGVGGLGVNVISTGVAIAAFVGWFVVTE